MDVLIDLLLTLGLLTIVTVACFIATRRVPVDEINTAAFHELAGEQDRFGHRKRA